MSIYEIREIRKLNGMLAQGHEPKSWSIDLQLTHKISCEYGCLNVAKYFYEKYPDEIDLCHLNNISFRLSCANGHKDVAEWLYVLSKKENKIKININTISEYAFKWSCINNHKHVASWLYYLSQTDDNTKIDIGIDKDQAFCFSCIRKNFSVIEWLCSISPRYIITFKGDQIYSVIINDNNIDRYVFEYNIGMVLLKDDYLKITDHHIHYSECERFYKIIKCLPLELTQKISHILCGSSKDVIKSTIFDEYYKKFNFNKCFGSRG